jgi:hypothetical protein
MKRKLSIIAGLGSMLLLGALIFTGCKKEDSTVPPPAGLPKLEKVSFDNEFIRFSYNADGYLKQAFVKDDLATAGEEIAFTVLYNEQNKIREVTTSDGRRLFPFYDNGEMHRVDVLNSINQLEAYTDYTYLNGRVKSATVYYLNGGLASPWLKFIFSYDATGNVTKTNLFVNDMITGQLIPAGQVTYEYDNRANPLAPVKDFLLLIWQTASVNNVKKEIHVSPDLSPDETLEYNYTYNSRNLPSGAAVVRTIPGQPAENLQLAFSYR